jgi:phosphonopyruvate decarboxylase
MKTTELLQSFRKCGISLFTGVPDSLQKDFCTLVASETTGIRHVAAPNEGIAVGLAIGHHLATGSTSLVYMQNSGLGNALNPLTSLAHSDVYRIPMVLMIGWRGQPGVTDEPQHKTQGAVTVEVLDLLEIPILTVDRDTPLTDVENFISDPTVSSSGPIALLVTSNTFESSMEAVVSNNDSLMSRELVLMRVVENTNEQCIVVSTTGKMSRELNEIRVKRNEQSLDFLTVGGMGHASSIALGLALERHDYTVICLDGDGAALMHLGALALIAEQKPKNFVHVLFNNGVHESVGSQPIAAKLNGFSTVAGALNYCSIFSIRSELELNKFLSDLHLVPKPCFVEIFINTYSRNDLTRPSLTPCENKKELMDRLSKAGI